MFLVDSHCHLGDLTFNGVEQRLSDVLVNAKNVGVTHMLCVNTDLPSFEPMYEKIKDLDNVYASVGVHPLNLADGWDEAQFRRYAALPKVIAIGEIGLDYYYEQESRDQQMELFARQLKLALELDKPIIIHSRSAHEDTWQVLNEVDPDCRLRGIFHCYADGWENAPKILDRGFYISVSGIVTFPKATNIHLIARNMPLDRLLVETDSPYLAPVPYRGKPNQPAFVEKVAREVARLKGITFEEVCQHTSANFERLFGLTLS